MKKILGLLALCALTLVACNDTPEPEPILPEPEPIVKAPIVTLDKDIVEATAEGGTFNVNYTIENAQEGVMLCVVEDVEWISDVTAQSGVISFVVAANETTKERNATLNVEYTGAETHTIAVTQAAKHEEPKPELATIILEVSDIIWNNACISVTPSANVEYILGIMTKEAFAPYTEDAETLVAARIAEWQETAEQYINMGYDDPWQTYMGYEQRSGKRVYDIKYDEIYNMYWDSEYVAYCFGMNDEGVQTASVAVKEFRTTAPVPSNNTFTISIDSITKSSVEFTVEPTTDEPYYVTIETIDVLAPYGPGKENSYEDLIKYLTPEYDSTIEKRTFSGKQTITNSDIGKTMNSLKSYKVVVWGFENGPTTEVFMSEEFTPADPE